MSKSKSTKVKPIKPNKTAQVRPVLTTSSSPDNITGNIELTKAEKFTKNVSNQIRTSIEEIFGRYDADGNGSIDSVELEALLRDVNILAGGGESIDLEKDVKEVLAAMGKDKGDGEGITVGKEDFVEWTLTKLLKGYGGINVGKTDKPRRKLSKTLPLQLERFLSSMGKVSMQIAAASSDTPKLCRDFRRYLPHELPEKESDGAATGLKLVTEGVKKEDGMESKPTTPGMAIHQAEARGTIKVACELLHLQIGVRVLFEQFGHHDKTIGAGMNMNDVKDVFKKLPIFYENVKSALPAEQIKELDLSLPNISTAADVPKVFRALDANGNGKIEMREFSDWFVAGSIRTPQQQMAFASKSGYNLRLTHLLRTVVMISQNMLNFDHIQKFSDNIYNLFISAKPRVHDMSITLQQLEEMFDAIRERMDAGKDHENVTCIFARSDAKHIFNSLDTDGDKVINDHEFMTWVMRGASLSYSERKLFTAEGDINMRVVNFLEVICVLCGGADLLDGMMLASQTASNAKTALEHGLKNLFSHFDADGSGEIDREELERLMIDLPARFYVSPESVCLREDVDLVMKTLDEDGGGTVDFEEWKNWIVKGTKKSRGARDKFASQSDGHRRLDLFMDTIVQISHEISAPLCEEKHELQPGLVTIFEAFDSNKSGELKAKDLLIMVESLAQSHSELTWFECTEQKSKELAVAVGGETQKISLNRWIEWFIRGARRPALERAKFASHSDSFQIINIFLESVLIVVRKSNLLMNSSKSNVKGYERSSGRHTSGYARMSQSKPTRVKKPADAATKLSQSV